MKGVLLAGGLGTRLMPLTKVTNKHLLPVWKKPMIMYPLQTLIAGGVKDILVVIGPEHSGHFLNILGSGRELGLHITYEIQEESRGIAHALGMAENFADGQSVAVILGDNIFEQQFDFKDFKGGARIYIKKVSDATRFGVPALVGNRVVQIEEKPTDPKSSFAVTGLYLYDNRVFDYIKMLKPSARGELEITDVNNRYIQAGNIHAEVIEKFWSDAGTFESLFRASTYMKGKEQE